MPGCAVCIKSMYNLHCNVYSLVCNKCLELVQNTQNHFKSIGLRKTTSGINEDSLKGT